MVIRTNSPRALEARRVNMELILSQHDNKCATCIRSGTCQLQKIRNDMGILVFPTHRPCTRQKGRLDDHVPALPRCKQVHQVHALHSGMRQSAVAVRLGYSAARVRATTIDVSENRVIKQADCSLCGQCITHCPTGALREAR